MAAVTVRLTHSIQYTSRSRNTRIQQQYVPVQQCQQHAVQTYTSSQPHQLAIQEDVTEDKVLQPKQRHLFNAGGTANPFVVS